MGPAGPADKTKVPHKLLLADDSVTIQRVIELTFADEDVQVVAVSDGDHAIARIASEPPDIVLADVGMPGKSGYDVAAYIKQNPKLAHIPVVLLTGAFEPVDQNRAKAVGCDGVLAKPFEPQLVIGRVKELLKRPAAAPAPAASAATPLRPLAPASAPAPAPSPFAATPAAASAGSGSPGSHDQWAASLSAQASAGASKEPGAVDNYFDRLDAAFATMSSGSPEAPKPPSVSDQIDWYGAKSPAPVAPEPSISITAPAVAATFADPAPAPAVLAAEAPAPAPAPTALAADVPAPAPAPVALAAEAPAAPAAVSAVATLRRPAAVAPIPEPVVTARGISLPPLADAFAAMLAAEQGSSSDGPAWPASLQAQPAVVSDELVDLVAKRVLEQLSDRVVRETVSQVVSEIAERLVREEIERLKASIK